jgi:HEPN domain-containing protein
VAAESWMTRATRLLREAHASAEAGNAEEARLVAHEAIYALQVELGEEPDPDDGPTG